MKYLRLFENFFADIESAVSNAGQPVLARKPQDSVQPEKPTLAKPEKPKKKKKLDQVETTEDEPNSYGEWLKTQVKEVVEFDESDKGNKVWVRLENGVSIQWEISMEDYPMVSASFKLGPDTIYLDDDTAGEIAKEFYDRKREYDPKAWATAMISSANELPQMKRDWEKRAVNRATDQDQEFSVVIADKFGTKKTGKK
jgi:hypothetical protein